MSKALTGFFKTRNEGEAAHQALLDAGFSPDEVGFLAGAQQAHETPVIGPALRFTGSQSEAASDTWIGAVAGLAAGALVSIPELGLLELAGPLAGIFGGLAVGGTVGGLFGLLRDHGITQEEAEFYAQGVRDGGSLVTVHGVDAARATKAHEMLGRAHALRVEDLEDDDAPVEGATFNICGEVKVH